MTPAHLLRGLEVMLNFKDHFSETSESYRIYRPEYPAELFPYLASLSPGHEKAWDCATGTGQVAVGLNKFFKNVIATDASKSQINNAKRESSITYSVLPAEQTDFDNQKFDIITVAQALHWFDINAFFKEANRVLKPGGILAVWSYNLISIKPKIDAIIKHFYKVVLGEYWPPERKLVENGYSGITFPFQKIDPPSFEMTAQWNLNQLIGYLTTWSAVGNFMEDRGISPIPKLREKFLHTWGDANKKLDVKWQLSLNIRKKNA